jgi:16S rRNA (uracil1498-N3)-methyltransferase
VARLRRSALEATKQCGLAWSPTIENPVALSEFLNQSTGNGWLADQQGAPAPGSMDSTGVTVIVGPEGGWTEDEREAVISAGYRPVALGRYTLRFETAALAAAAAISQARMRR